MDSRHCPHCEAYRTVREDSRYELLAVRGENINVLARVLVCDVCGHDIPDPVRDDDTLRSAYAEYRRRRGLLGPEVIRETRAKYGLSQRQLGRLLGWGAVTIQRYESGALQDAAHDQVLRQLDEPDFVLRQTRSPSCQLSARESAALQLRLSSPQHASDPEPSQAIADLVEGRFSRKARTNPLHTGFRPFSLEKLGRVAQAILIRVPGRVFKTKLAKLLWLSDFLFFAENTVSMTGLAYARLPYGPAPEHYSLLLAALEESGAVQLISEESWDFSGEIIASACSQDPNPRLDPAEVDVIERVIAHFGAFSSSALSELTHKERAWAQRSNGNPLLYTIARDTQLVRQMLR